jgi:hypothetical protein
MTSKPKINKITKITHIPTYIPIAKIVAPTNNKFIVKEENEKDLNTRLKMFYGCY